MPEVTGAPGARSPALLTTLVLLCTTTAVVSSIGGTMVPDVAEQYDVSLGSAQWVLTSTMLVGAVTTPVLGRLGGNSCRRPVILIGLAVVALGLMVSALPLGFAGLITGRVLQGVGLALVPLALATAREVLPRDRVPGALALLSVANVAGAGIGFPVAAWTAQHAGLSTAYWLGFGTTLATLALAAATIPHSTTRMADTVHWAGAALLALGTVAVLLALTVAPYLGWLSPASVGLWALGAALLVVWVRVSLRTDAPVVDLRLARQRSNLPANFAAITAGVAAYMLLALVMVQVQLPRSTGFGLGVSLMTAGLLISPYAVATVLGSRLSAVVGRRVGADLVLPIGATIYGVSGVVYVLAHESMVGVVVMMTMGGLGSGFTFAAMPSLVLRETPQHETGSVMAFNVLLRFLGFSIGGTLATTVLASFSRTGEPDLTGFLVSAWTASGLWFVTAAVCLALVTGRGGSRVAVTRST